MQPSPNVIVRVDLEQIRQNVRAIRMAVDVPIFATVKADAYGLGAVEVSGAIKDLVDGFAVFRLQEAIDAQLSQRTKKRVIALGPPIAQLNPLPYIEQGVTPAVSDLEQATALRIARPALCVDTGMQRFACPPEQVQACLQAGEIHEAFTHATQLEHAHRLKSAVKRHDVKLHAAGTALLNEKGAWLDAVRPGLALYEGAARVTTRLVEVHTSAGPAGYGGFVSRRHGVILAGYSNGLRNGVCSIGGQERKILEIGMQSAFVEIGENDRAGDEVVLLGDAISENKLSQVWGTSPQEVIVTLSSAGVRVYDNR